VQRRSRLRSEGPVGPHTDVSEEKMLRDARMTALVKLHCSV